MMEVTCWGRAPRQGKGGGKVEGPIQRGYVSIPDCKQACLFELAPFVEPYKNRSPTVDFRDKTEKVFSVGALPSLVKSVPQVLTPPHFHLMCV